MGLTISTNITSTTTGGVQTAGSTDGSSATAGNVGEIIQATATSVSITTSINEFDITSISLTAGAWVLSGHCYLTNGTGANYVTAGISTTAGNSTTGLTQGNTLMIGAVQTGQGIGGATISNLSVIITTTTTYYLKGASSFTSPTPFISGRLTAVRIR